MTKKPVRFQKLLCDKVEYRKGVVEIAANVHPGSINLEVLAVKPEADLVSATNGYYDLEEDVSGSAELELSVPVAKQLIEQLHEAISEAENALSSAE